MKVAFVDTLCLVAFFNPSDQWHQRAIDVLVQFLNFFSEYTEKARRGAAVQAEAILSGANVEVVPQSHEAFSRVLPYMKRVQTRATALRIASR